MSIEEERAIVDAATPGPWEYSFDPHIGWGWVSCDKFNPERGHSGIAAKALEADGELIARARTMYPLALDVVEAAKAPALTFERLGSDKWLEAWWTLQHAIAAFEAATE